MSELLDRQNTTFKTIPATPTLVPGKRSRNVDASFPQLDKPSGLGYGANEVRKLRGYLLSNAIAEMRPVGPAFPPNDVEIRRGRGESAIYSQTYWGFSDASSTSLDYYGYTGAPNGIFPTIPDKTQAGKVEDEEGNVYLLASPYIPNLLIPYQPDQNNTVDQISAYESLLARTPVLEDGEPVVDDDGNPVTRRSRVLTQRADDANIDDLYNPMQTSNFITRRFSPWHGDPGSSDGGGFGAAPTFPEQE